MYFLFLWWNLRVRCFVFVGIADIFSTDHSVTIFTDFCSWHNYSFFSWIVVKNNKLGVAFFIFRSLTIETKRDTQINILQCSTFYWEPDRCTDPILTCLLSCKKADMHCIMMGGTSIVIIAVSLMHTVWKSLSSIHTGVGLSYYLYSPIITTRT